MFLRKIFLFLFAYKKLGKIKANTNKRYITDNILSLIIKYFMKDLSQIFLKSRLVKSLKYFDESF